MGDGRGLIFHKESVISEGFFIDFSGLKYYT